MHGYAEKSCTKLAPFFPGTILGLRAKIPQSAEFPRQVAADAELPHGISGVEAPVFAQNRSIPRK